MHFILAITVSLAGVVAVLAGNTTCLQTNITWWNAAGGESPCLEYQRLMQICNPGFQMYNTAYPPYYNPCDNVGCCCNTIAYSLWSACWSCQWGYPYPDYPATYATFLGAGLSGQSGIICPDGLNFGVLPPEYAIGLAVDPPPKWTYLPYVDTTSNWNYTLSEANATAELTLSSSIPIFSMQSTQSVASTASVASASAASVLASHKKSEAGVIAGAVVGGIAALSVAAGAILIYCFRRRKQNSEREMQEYRGPMTPATPTPWNHQELNTASPVMPPASGQLAHSTSFPSDLNDYHVFDVNVMQNSSQYAVAGSKAQLLAYQEPRSEGPSTSSSQSRSRSPSRTLSDGPRITSSDLSDPRTSVLQPVRTPREEDAGISFGDAGHDVLPPLYQPEWNNRR